ncbi:LysR family transcriptional regulator [Halomonas maura]|uniref:LysR family transcriptional regulator n=1 Tax=Halomonas maura TaxID=117606 RepID=UPI0025B288F9|nr:LysR family transcriptional regulator [Halomonas maura]MDN3556888.1 LysR family transcriptional regulator [Halomonas maura]
MLDLLLLRSFVAVIDEGSFTRAAHRLHLTQPAISGHLRRLEAQVGKPLLQRTTRAFEVTPDGECLAGYARAILALNRDAMTQLSRSKYQSNVRLGVAEDCAHPLLLQTLKSFMDDNPGVDIGVHVGIPGDMVTAMKRGDVDLVLGAQCGTHEPGRLLWREPMVWAWAERAPVRLSAPLPLALFPEPCPYREAALSKLALSGIAQRTAMLCTSGASLRAAAESEFALAPMPASQLTSGLVALTSEYGLPALPDAEFMLMTSPAGDQAVLTALADGIAEHLVVSQVAEPA